jgi:hypothetical protein
MSTMRIALSLATLMLVPACDDAVVERGRIEFYSDPAIIEMPTIVSVGEAFSARIVTYGGGCIDYHSTEVEAEGADTVIEPYDRHSGASVCTSDLRTISHDVTLRFDAAGTETVVVRGRRVDGNTDEVIEIPVAISIN